MTVTLENDSVSTYQKKKERKNPPNPLRMPYHAVRSHSICPTYFF